MIKTGFAREVITPALGIPLVGYFNPRPNKGVLDNLYVKTLLFQKGKKATGIISFDLCFVSEEMLEGIRKRLIKKGMKFAKDIIMCATHTHTGPYVCSFFGAERDEKYCSLLIDKAVLSVEEAYKNLHDSEISFGSVKSNPFAYNRRYYMKGGRVVTNPGKLNPDIVKPEGPVDNEIGFITIKQDGRITSVIANIINHTDTVGGDLVSGDWPSMMEKEIQQDLGYEANVITLIGCSGNINHLDVSTGRNQSSYEEAKRIGKGYARIILDNLKKAEKLSEDDFKVSVLKTAVKNRKIFKGEIEKAKEIVKNFKFDVDKDLTSEDLAKGHGSVTYFFANQLLEFNKKSAGKTRNFDLTAIKFGKKLALTTLPCEAFTEIGMEIKKHSSFAKTFVISLAQGECGYVPMKECFERGGYEILPIEGGGSREDTCELLVKNTLKILE
ncbi:MAG: hypothetical protein A2017_19325 [Lentisphaerae bacterium GWF2_44_16]|nr:MAG: hypothetical protein A2017_19325 [Lentisphaerae bacterium GWF2_44_16]